MDDYFPAVARGVRDPEGAPAPPRPDEDERWEYLAEHLKAMRGSLGLLAFVAFLQIAGLVIGLIMVMSEN